MRQNVMNFVSKTSNKGSPQMKTSKIIKVAHQIRKQPWEKFPKLIIVGATTIRQVRVCIKPEIFPGLKQTLV